MILYSNARLPYENAGRLVVMDLESEVLKSNQRAESTDHQIR